MAKTATLRAAAVAAAAAIMLPLAACGGNGGGAGGSAGSSPHAATGTPVTRQQAGRIVTGRYGGQVKSIEPDHEQGRPTWEVEVENSREGRIEADVAKNTGRILAVEKD